MFNIQKYLKGNTKQIVKLKIPLIKSDSRLVVYRFILFYFVLYICIYVAPWSCEAWHLITLYVHTCSGMTIKLNLNLNLKSVTYVYRARWGLNSLSECVRETAHTK